MENEVDVIEVEKIPKGLAKQFFGTGEVRGFSFTQLAANDRAYLYQVEEPSGTIHYEIFQRKISKANSRVIRGVVHEYPDMVLYPKASAFGIWAFSCYGLATARLRFEVMSGIAEKKDG